MATNDSTQRKNWENDEIMKIICQNNKQMSVVWTECVYFSVDSANEINVCNQPQTNKCRKKCCFWILNTSAHFTDKIFAV